VETTVIVAVITVLAAPLAALLTWLLNRRKHISDIYSVLSESSQTAVETMQLTMTELRLELQESREKIDDLMQENKVLKLDLIELKEMNIRLLSENQKLKNQMEDLARQIHRFHSFDSESE
jgi:FtsZ-binding cell division protein ZapB